VSPFGRVRRFPRERERATFWARIPCGEWHMGERLPIMRGHQCWKALPDLRQGRDVLGDRFTCRPAYARRGVDFGSRDDIIRESTPCCDGPSAQAQHTQMRTKHCQGLKFWPARCRCGGRKKSPIAQISSGARSGHPHEHGWTAQIKFRIWEKIMNPRRRIGWGSGLTMALNLHAVASGAAITWEGTLRTTTRGARPPRPLTTAER